MFLKADREIVRCERVMRQRVLPYIDITISTCHVRAARNPGEPVAFSDFLKQATNGTAGFADLAIGEVWGTTWGTTWFEITGVIPAERLERALPTELIVDLGWNPNFVGGHLEGLAYRPDGTAIKGLNPRNENVPLISNKSIDPAVSKDGSFKIYVEGAYNPLILGSPSFVKTELGNEPTGKADQKYRLRRVDLCAFNAEAFDYYEDLDVLYSLLPTLDPKSQWYWQIVKALQRSMNVYDERDLTTLTTARQILKPILATRGGDSRLHLTACGHSHIDCGWLWPVRETKRKVARTVANALQLMKDDPTYLYAMSSAQQYAWLQHDHPDLFRQVQKRVREGRFIPVGGMWVESDGMLPSGESLIRQMSYGQRYFVSQLGVRAEGIWLPDSFGYTGSFPQIAKRAGYKWFLSQKIAWSDTTRFPHHTFLWEGIDGSRIFTHFPPTDTYDSQMTAQDLHYTEENFRDKDLSDQALLLFGYGDGGGGPTRQLLARVHRYADLQGVPTVTIGSPNDYFKHEMTTLPKQAGSEMPVWKGELYLELHRKTLTSQQEMKRLCRSEEALLRSVEYLCLYADVICSDYTYPVKELDRIWKTLLLNQFHDILPGSGIAWLYRQAKKEYVRDGKALRALAHRACNAVIASDKSVPVIAHARISPVTQGHEWEPVSVIDAAPSDGMSARLVRDGDNYRLENDALRVTISSTGRVISVVDKRHDNAELVPADHPLCVYELMDDKPEMWDAWNVERDAFLTASKLTGCVVDANVAADGSARVYTLVRTRKSKITTTISLGADTDRLKFSAHVAWHEEEKLLKVDMPLAITADMVQCETQYGLINHPVVKNLPEDEAKFEFCTHRFMRLENASYAASVVNASTYGADASPLRDTHGRPDGTMLRMTLLASPQIPDPHTDIGDHDFMWTLVPHSTVSSTLEEAHRLTAPVLADVPELEPLAHVDSDNGMVILDWMKIADDGSNDVILRLYEAQGGEADTRLTVSSVLGADITAAEVGCLEQNELPDDEPRVLDQPTHVGAEGIKLHFQPFELATIRLHREGVGLV